MIKICLGVSLLLNIFLIYFGLNNKPEKIIVEKFIVKTEVSKVDPLPVSPQKEVSEKVKTKKELAQPVPFDHQEYVESSEKTEADRTEFLTQKLGASEEKISRHNKLRQNFFKDMDKLWKNKTPGEDLSLKERRRLLTLEEELHQSLEKLHGKKNWDRYQKFRDKYNTQGLKNETENNQPFIFMGL